MKVFGLVLVVVLLSVVAYPAMANGGLIGFASVTLWSDKDQIVKSGINLDITFGEVPGGPTTACTKVGMDDSFTVPTDKYGVFADLSYIRFTPTVAGVEPRFVQDLDTSVSGREGLCMDNGSAVFCVSAFAPDVYDTVTSVQQNQSRHDDKGLVPWVLQIFGRKTHHQIATTDQRHGRFIVADISDWIEDFCEYQLGINITNPQADPHKLLTPEQLQLIRAAYIEAHMKNTVQFVRPRLDWPLLSQGYAMRARGLQLPLDPPGPTTPPPPPPASNTSNQTCTDGIHCLHVIVDGIEQQGQLSVNPGQTYRLEITGATAPVNLMFLWPNSQKSEFTSGTVNFNAPTVSGVTTLLVMSGNEATRLELVTEVK